MSTETPPQPRLRRWVIPAAVCLAVGGCGVVVSIPLLLSQLKAPSFGGAATEEPTHQPVVLPDKYREPTTTYGEKPKPPETPAAPVVQASLLPLPSTGNGATPPPPAALAAYQTRPVDPGQIPTAVLQGRQGSARVEHPRQVAPSPQAAPVSVKEEPTDKPRWGIPLTHAQRYAERLGQQRSPKEREDGTRREAAKNLFKHAIWATPAVPTKTLYRQQSIPGVTVDEMVSDIPGQYKIRVSVPVFDRFERDVELIPKDAIIIIMQESVPGFGQNRMVLGVEEIQPPTPEVISLKATVGGSEGQAGVGGRQYVDNHYPQLILATLISTAVNIGGRVLAGNPQGYQYSVGQEVARDVGQQVSTDTKSIVDKQLRIPPTITIPAGTAVSISLKENVMFSRAPVVVK
jgi:type IV secretory pathway VirB10-like protein